MLEPTHEEAKAIAALHHVARRWPKSLWLYSASGELCVMRKGPDGKHALDSTGSVDRDYYLDTVPIENDGGDW